MPLAKSELETMINDAFPGAEVNINDLAGDNDHWALEIISEKFCGKSRIQQHKMVYTALKGAMDGPLHALQLSTKIPS
jgi:stress-induced morphogen